MINGNDLARISKVLNENESISICLPTSVTQDTVAAGVALYFALMQMNKSVTIACASDIQPDFQIVGQDKIQKNLVESGDTLVVSFPYVDGSVDKITYNIENERFNLIIKPRQGSPRLDTDDVKYSYTGGKTDVILTLYAPTLNSLGELYTANQDMFTGVNIVNIDRHFTNAGFGSINVVDKKVSSMSEMVLEIIDGLKLSIDKDIATNLYAGIVAATNNFTAHSVNAETFESVAQLMKFGAVKKPYNAPAANSGFGQTAARNSFDPWGPQDVLGADPFGGSFGNAQSFPQPSYQANQPQVQQNYETATPSTQSIPRMPIGEAFDTQMSPSQPIQVQKPTITRPQVIPPVQKNTANQPAGRSDEKAAAQSESSIENKEIDEAEGGNSAETLRPNIFNKPKVQG